jgi:hypothetical protein
MKSFLLCLLLSLWSVATSANLLAPRRMMGPMVGGYTPVDVQDEQVQAVAQFAVQALAFSQAPYSFSLTSSKHHDYKPKVVSASQQVVAGMNYRLTIICQDSKGKCVGAFSTVVYNQFGAMSVTTWGDELSCHEAELITAIEIESNEFGETGESLESESSSPEN